MSNRSSALKIQDDEVSLLDFPLEIRLVEFDPEKAQSWLDNKKFERQRTIDKVHVAILASSMSGGEFLGGELITVCVLPDGTEFLTNGYCRLTAVVKSRATIKFYVRRVLVNSMEDVRLVYTKHDVDLKRRSLADVIKGLGYDVSRGSKLGTAIRFLYRLSYGSLSTPPKKVPDDLFRSFLEDYIAIELQRKKIFKEATTIVQSACERGGVMAVTLLTLRHLPVKAQEFWSAIATDDGLRKGSPEKTLLETLKADRPSGDYDLIKNGAWAAHAWNKHIAGEPLDKIKLPDAFSLSGVPMQKLALPDSPEKKKKRKLAA